jgi:hypothetical protein
MDPSRDQLLIVSQSAMACSPVRYIPPRTLSLQVIRVHSSPHYGVLRWFSLRRDRSTNNTLQSLIERFVIATGVKGNRLLWNAEYGERQWCKL